MKRAILGLFDIDPSIAQGPTSKLGFTLWLFNIAMEHGP
jgi:hypothetical protein